MTPTRCCVCGCPRGYALRRESFQIADVYRGEPTLVARGVHDGEYCMLHVEVTVRPHGRATPGDRLHVCDGCFAQALSHVGRLILDTVDVPIDPRIRTEAT